jgi:hypothetical protein
MQATSPFGTVKILMLKGEKGDKFTFQDLTPEDIAELKGEKGDPFTFADFTTAQLDDLREGITSVYYRILEGTYTTGTGGVDTVEIPVEYTSKDILIVDIEGLVLSQGADYTVDGSSIVLNTPIDHAGARVGFKVLRALALTPQDYSALRGDKGEKGDPGSFSDMTEAEKQELIDMIMAEGGIPTSYIDTMMEGWA